MTLLISAAAMVLAIALGLVLALARLPSPAGLAAGAGARLATVYVELFRGTPVLLQLYVLYFGLAPFYPLHPLRGGHPRPGPQLRGLRGGDLPGRACRRCRAARSRRPRRWACPGAMVLRRVVLPQAFRFSLPGVANDFIALLKDSSLVSVITVVELTKRMTIAAVDSGGWLVPGPAVRRPVPGDELPAVPAGAPAGAAPGTARVTSGRAC